MECKSGTTRRGRPPGREVLDSAGREPKSFLTEKERTQLLGIAMRWPLWWGFASESYLLIGAGGYILPMDRPTRPCAHVACRRPLPGARGSNGTDRRPAVLW